VSARALEVLWKEIKDGAPRGADAIRCRRYYFDALMEQIPKIAPDRHACVGFIGSAFGVEVYVWDGMPKGTVAQFIRKSRVAGQPDEVLRSVVDSLTIDKLRGQSAGGE